MLPRAEEAFRFASDVCASPASAASRWKALSGRKAAGCLPLYLPEEVVHAAGMLPVTVWGNEYPPGFRGTAGSPSACPVSAGIAGAVRSGLWACLDAWACPSTCEPLLHAFEGLFPAPGSPPAFSFVFPGGPVDAPAREELLDRVEAFREWAGEASGRGVSEGALERSVRTYNENRRAFFLLEERMADAPGWISGKEYHALAGAGMAIPKEVHTRVLRAAVSRTGAAPAMSRAKVFLCGAMATFPLMSALDGSRAAIVGNDLALGRRYYEEFADESGDMSVSLVRRHFRRDPCPTLHGGGRRRLDHLLGRVAACGADRVVFLRVPWCEPDSGGMAEAAFRERGIPFLLVDVDLHEANRTPAAARIEGFVETGE